MKNIILFSSLFIASSSFATTIVVEYSDHSSGEFEILKVQKPVVDCKEWSGGASVREQISPKGCVLSLKKLSKIKERESKLTRFEALGGPGSCEFEKGKVLVVHLSRNCCKLRTFSGCENEPREHSNGMWAKVLGVWYIAQPDESEKYPDDHGMSLKFSRPGELEQTPPQSVFSKILDWFVERF